jgi:hypothetical protein
MSKKGTKREVKVSNRKIPRQIEKKLYQEANSQCMVCGLDEICVLTIHHIIPYSKNPLHNPEHMIVLCANCHAKAERGDISRETLYNYKRRLRTNIIKFPKPNSFKDGISVVGDRNITAGRDIHVDIKMPKGKKSFRPIVIPGTVAEDARMYGYLNYLVDKYNKFKEWDCKRGNLKMNYALIRIAYKREMKYNIKDTPKDLFDRAVEYLQKRISNTKIGRIMKSRGEELFSRFETFDQKEKD